MLHYGMLTDDPLVADPGQREGEEGDDREEVGVGPIEVLELHEGLGREAVVHDRVHEVLVLPGRHCDVGGRVVDVLFVSAISRHV